MKLLNNNFWYFILLIVSYIFAACSNLTWSTKNITGKYQAGLGGYLGTDVLSLSEDKTFTIDIFWGESSGPSGYLEGNWVKKGRFVYLNYNLTPKFDHPPNTTEGKAYTDSTIILVSSENGSIPFANVICKSKRIQIAGVSNLDGRFAIKTISIDTLIVSAIGYSTTVYTVIDSNSTLFKVDLGGNRRYYKEYFNSHLDDYIDTFELSKNKLCEINNSLNSIKSSQKYCFQKTNKE